MLALKDKAKWEAWNSRKGATTDVAKEEYVKTVKKYVPAEIGKNL